MIEGYVRFCRNGRLLWRTFTQDITKAGSTCWKYVQLVKPTTTTSTTTLPTTTTTTTSTTSTTTTTTTSHTTTTTTSTSTTTTTTTSHTTTTTTSTSTSTTTTSSSTTTTTTTIPVINFTFVNNSLSVLTITDILANGSELPGHPTLVSPGNTINRALPISTTNVELQISASGVPLYTSRVDVIPGIGTIGSFIPSTQTNPATFTSTVTITGSASNQDHFTVVLQDGVPLTTTTTTSTSTSTTSTTTTSTTTFAGFGVFFFNPSDSGQTLTVYDYDRDNGLLNGIGTLPPGGELDWGTGYPNGDILVQNSLSSGTTDITAILSSGSGSVTPSDDTYSSETYNYTFHITAIGGDVYTLNLLSPTTTTTTTTSTTTTTTTTEAPPSFTAHVENTSGSAQTLTVYIKNRDTFITTFIGMATDGNILDFGSIGLHDDILIQTNVISGTFPMSGVINSGTGVITPSVQSYTPGTYNYTFSITAINGDDYSMALILS